MLISSCSSDNKSDEIPALGTFLKTADYVGNSIVSYTYSGNMLVNKDYNNGIIEKITYSGKEIIKIEHIIGGSNVDFVTEYTYQDGKLVYLINTYSNGNISKIEYAYNTDNTVFYEKYIINNSVEFKEREGTYTFEKGNLVKNVYTTYFPNDFPTSGSLFTDIYEYDSKNNPFKDVLGYSLLLVDENNFPISVNNVTKRTHIDADKIYYENPYFYTYSYSYDSNGFPKGYTGVFSENGYVFPPDIVKYIY